MPVDGDRSMVTVDPGVRASAADVAALEPRAVALSLDQLYCVPAGAAAYVTCGDDDARAFARRPPAKLAGARALFVSKREALTLTEESDVTPPRSARAQRGARDRDARRRGRDGARRRPHHHVPAIATTALDTTGAGDLLVAAYIWGDLHGATPEECLRWAVIYAGSRSRCPPASAVRSARPGCSRRVRSGASWPRRRTRADVHGRAV